MKNALIRDSMSGQVTGAKAISNNAPAVRLYAAIIMTITVYICICDRRDHSYNKWKYYI